MPNFPKGVGKIKVSNMIVLLKVYVVSYANSEQKSGNDLFCSSKNHTLRVRVLLLCSINLCLLKKKKKKITLFFVFHKDEKSNKEKIEFGHR